MTTTYAGRRVGLAVGVFYGLLLATSFSVRHGHRPAAGVDSLEHRADVWAVDHDRVGSAPVRIAYRDYQSGSEGDVATIVLLHGSPGRKQDFESLAPVLARTARVVVPDLPGFGSSTRTLPDYSFHAHALYVLQLLDHLGVPRVHVLGYSMGGGVALSLVDVAPERVASLTMVSAIGVQEMELTGDYYVNHVVHGAQLGALWIAREGTPHMGLLDDAMLGVPYARNFFDSDQRPLRGVLQRTSVPTLIVHGVDDSQVPIEAAREHHRLVPQSELRTLPGDHFLVLTKAADVGTLVTAFVQRVTKGQAKTLAGADAWRVRCAALSFDPRHLPRVRGIAAAVFGGVLAAAALLSQSVTSVAAGLFVARGRLSLPVAMSGCFAGIGMAGLLSHFGSRVVGRRTVRTAPTKRFAAFSLLTSAMRSALLLVAGAVASSVLSRFSLLASTTPNMSAAIMIGIITCVLRLGLAATTARGRRLLVSTWRRSTRWEFWPPWVFYPPVVAYVVWLFVKHRSATLFTAANPAIEAGGFVGESKYDILQGLAGAGDFVASSCLIDGRLGAAAKVLAARRFMAARSLTFPIVLKPNCGQRGSGVVIARSADVLEDCLSRSSLDTIVQEYVAGLEFGVFYYRRPSESHGRIFSVTEKSFPAVVGDGRRTLEQLILHDERAVCAARLYCERHREKLSCVLVAGEAFPLVDLGTHCRGAMFLDGGWVLTPALVERFDTIARGFDGFNFGRFDVRLEGGIDAFRAGHGFKIIELNGVTSEATHIYHPGTTLMTAYRVLMRQWRIAFEIGGENHRRGVPLTSLGALFQLTRESVQTSRRHLQEHSDQSGLQARALRAKWSVDSAWP